MKRRLFSRARILLCAALLLCLTALSACSPAPEAPENTEKETAVSRYLRVVDNEPDTVDFQCTTLHYTVALNVFDRLVETVHDEDGNTGIVPSLAKSWTVSPDGLKYTFRLQEGVTFSDGTPLTAKDVCYTFTRLLTHPKSRSREIAAEIVGADALSAGEADTLEGFGITGDLDFTITLAEPFPAFLSSLSTPAASILSEKSVTAAGDAFGMDAEHTVGTGPFILESREAGKGMTLSANPNCWSGAPACEGLRLLYVTDEVEQRLMFERGELDILDLDKLGNEAEYFTHGDIYQDRLYSASQVDISYIALNQSVKPLDNVKVRQALQMSLNRRMLLDTFYSGRGALENGIFPHGLTGFNPDLEPIPYDEAGARNLLAEAGYPDGFDLEIVVNASAGRLHREMMSLAASMWAKIGVRATVLVLEESEFMAHRTGGRAACYTGTWSADYNDPDNFIYSFFGSPENTVYRSLCYPDTDTISRVQDARSITDNEARLAEYARLEKKIIREDASWIPLFSRTHLYVTGERVTHFETAWNGWIQPCLRSIAIE